MKTEQDDEISPGDYLAVVRPHDIGECIFGRLGGPTLQARLARFQRTLPIGRLQKLSEYEAHLAAGESDLMPVSAGRAADDSNVASFL